MKRRSRTQGPVPLERNPPKIRKGQLPFLLINMSMTADGKIATANRAVTSFGSKRDQEHLLELRATADAVMCGARTADVQPINMGPGPAKYRRLRLKRGLSEYNLRVIVSGSGTLNPRAEVFKHKFSPVIVLTTRRVSRRRVEELQAAGAEVLICGEREIDFSWALRELRLRWGVRRLLCEGGGELNDALFRAGVVDELHLTICPKVFGGRNSPTISGGRGMRTLAEATRLEIKSSRRWGDEMFLMCRVRK